MAKSPVPHDPLFCPPRVNGRGLEKVDAVMGLFSKMLRDLEGAVALGGREGALVRTHLEEACTYAKKTIALTKEFQEPV